MTTLINRTGLTFAATIASASETRIARTDTHEAIVVPIPLDVVVAKWNSWRGGDYIQTAFPLSQAEREFFMTGITPAQWAELFEKEPV